MKFALCALGVSLAFVCSSAMATPKSETIQSASIGSERNIIQTEMKKMKESMSILRTTQSNDLAWDAIVDLRFATWELIENIPPELESKIDEKENYLSILKRLEALTIKVEDKLNQDQLSQIQPLLDEIDKIKTDGHKAFKK